jgi:hypothetical protein
MRILSVGFWGMILSMLMTTSVEARGPAGTKITQRQKLVQRPGIFQPRQKIVQKQRIVLPRQVIHQPVIGQQFIQQPAVIAPYNAGAINGVQRQQVFSGFGY